MVRSRTQKVTGYVVLIVFLILILLPFYWMFITSFKVNTSISEYPPSLFPLHWTLEHYRTAFSSTYHFGTYIRNSVVVAVLTTFFVLMFASMAGFSIARLPIKAKTPMMMGLLMISVFPPIAIIIPLYMMLHEVGWLNSYQALIIPYTAFNLPFAIWILRNFFLQVPGALFEAAKIDGASVFQTFYRVFLPLTTPGLFTAAVFTFVASWTEFFMALVLNTKATWQTIPVGIALFSGEYSVPYGDLFAGSIVSIVPILILVVIFRKWIVSGLTAGAVKG
ncbi:carbohydrate ABC transporter permease [Alicyclobacillus mengziensis]|uniref:Carbohydrate ABC transporter permease n=1 Tax=Alicyclobacillus mengziensis TaxID=2931921 RepID=A0A9X7Z702_9BACL|nr:carbohydrate ABC transporter permease [Alicyclobacillus mengziensis]QSO46936.1 carbohydrate ABC transporter permease [Alicyclobacillus mengziensis]